MTPGERRRVKLRGGGLLDVEVTVSKASTSAGPCSEERCFQARGVVSHKPTQNLLSVNPKPLGRGVTCVLFCVTCVFCVACVFFIARKQQSRTRGPCPRPSQVDASRLQSGFRPLLHVADRGYQKEQAQTETLLKKGPNPERSKRIPEP